MANYLYNGVELPDINEIWTEEIKVQHPYAYIVRSFLGYRLTCTNSPLYQARFTDAEELTYPISAGREVQYIQYSCNFGGSAWSYYDSGLKKNPEPNDIHWCNTDLKICITDTKSTSFTLTDEVYLAASEPVPVGGTTETTLDPTALLMGWMVGKRVAGLRKTQTDVPVVPDEPDVPETPDKPSGDPVAYLYNGVRLPDINEVWTDELKAQYPYALITVGYDSAHTADYYELFLSDQPVTARAYDTGDASYLNKSGATMYYLRLVLSGNTWGEHPTDYSSTLSNGKYKSGSGTFLYANYDVLKKDDGTTYLAASEPVAVYE